LLKNISFNLVEDQTKDEAINFMRISVGDPAFLQMATNKESFYSIIYLITTETTDDSKTGIIIG